MMVPAAVFTCSICGEISSNLCSYCTKDACANHRCERCKRCSDCCECEYPLSAEESVPVPVEAASESTPEAAPAGLEPEAPQAEESGMEAPSTLHGFLTAEESSVFADESDVRKPPFFAESNVFAEEDDSGELPQDDDPFAPRE